MKKITEAIKRASAMEEKFKKRELEKKYGKGNVIITEENQIKVIIKDNEKERE